MAEPGSTSTIVTSLVLLGAAVVAVPAFRFVGLSAVIGYLVAGLVIGPSGIGLFSEPALLRSFAELGIVMFLFVIGLELKPSKLVSMKRDILGLGLLQMIISSLALAVIFWLAGLAGWALAIAAFAFALSPTAIALQILEERGALASNYGQKSFAVLLFQDMAIVPVIALLPLLAIAPPGGNGGFAAALPQVGLAIGALVALVLAGRFLLNPLFRLLAKTDAREVMTAAALLVVLGAAELMHVAGLSAALGAFVAGLLLSESNFRHQLEADIEPFRGLLLGLFFISVGMSLEAKVILANLVPIVFGAVLLMALKAGIAYSLMRTAPIGSAASARAAVLLAPAGEFAFVILPLAATIGLISGETGSILAALAALTMFLGPLAAKALESLLDRRRAQRASGENVDFEEDYSEAGGEVLVIGFGRFGQVVNQIFLTANRNVTVIDRNIDQIKTAARFGFKVYYGDGRRLDVMRAAGAEKAVLIAICIDDREATLAIAEMAQRTFPQAKLFARAFDRIHALDLMERGVRFPFRETFDSALVFGQQALVSLGMAQEEADEIRQDVRRRDIARLLKQRDEGMFAGADLLAGSRITPEPLAAPRRMAENLSRKPDPAPAQAVEEGVTGASS